MGKPQTNAIQRMKLWKSSESKMIELKNDINNSIVEIGKISLTFKTIIDDLKVSSSSEFFTNQPNVEKDLDAFKLLLKDLNDKLDDLKSKSSSLAKFMNSDNIDTNLISAIEQIVLNDKHADVETTTNGSNGSETIDPANYIPPVPEIITNNRMPAEISFINSPSDFYIHSYIGMSNFVMEIQNAQNALIKKGITGFNSKVEPNIYCVARYSDFYWYRAKVIDVLPDNKAKVFFYDYGNQEIVDFSDMMPMAAEIGDKPMGAINCQLLHFQPEEGWSKEANDVFSEKVSKGTIFCYASEPSPKISSLGEYPAYPVELFLPDDSSVWTYISKFVKK